jgi:hypothetical protein
MTRKLTHHEESTDHHQQNGSRSRCPYIRYSSRESSQAWGRSGSGVRRICNIVSPGKVPCSVEPLQSSLVSSRGRHGFCSGGNCSRGRGPITLGPTEMVNVVVSLKVEESHRADVLASKSIIMNDSIPRNPGICILNTVEGEWLALK